MTLLDVLGHVALAADVSPAGGLVLPESSGLALVRVEAGSATEDLESY